MAARENSFETEPLNRRAVFISWRWLAIAACLIIAALVVVIIALKSRGSRVERGTRALVEAFSKRRLIEPRLSGGFKGGEFTPSREDLSGVNTDELERARELIMDSVTKGDWPAQIAYARLLLSAGEKPQEAFKYLQRVLAASTESAEAHNDMGVCFIEQGKIEDAIDEFETALKHKTDMAEGLYNRALCYQKLQLRDAARNDLIRLANIERDKGWFKEINERVGTLSSPLAGRKSYVEVISAFDVAIESGDTEQARQIAGESSELLRRHVLIELCVEQLRSTVSGESKKAELYMSAIDFVGKTFETSKNDQQISDAAQYLRTLPERERAEELALTHDYAEALRAFEANRLDEAQSAFERLATAFERRGNSVFAETSSLLVAQCYYRNKRIARSVEVLQEGLRRIKGRKWTYHRARVLTQLAIGYSRLGRDSVAVKYCEEALSLCPNDPELKAKVLQFISLPYWHVGDLDTALARLRDSTYLYLEQSALPGKFENLAYNYYQFADIYGLKNKHSLALLYAQQALEYSEEAQNYHYAAEFASVSALAHARLNRLDEAESDLKRAFEYAGKLPNGKIRDATEAFLHTNEGEVAEIKGDLQRALDSYATAEAQVSRDEGNIIPKINVLRGRAEAYAASTLEKEARSSLLQAVSLIESYRIGIDSSDQRSEFLNASQGVFDKLIWLDAAALGRSPEAFDMCERSRARTLLEEMSQANIQDDRSRPTALPLTLTQVQSQLAPGLMLLEYSVTSDGALLFLVTNSTFEVVRLSAKAEELDARVADYVSDIRSLAPLDELSSKARALYEILLEPAFRYLDSHTLCIVPDKSLHFLPFGALVDASGKYLVETKAITYAPSSTTFIACDVRGRNKPPAAHERMLAVGNPQFNRDVYDLESLADAAVEAREVAAAYQPNAIILTGAEASEPAVRAAMRSCNVAHLAVHCLVEETSPWLAALVLADPASAKDGLGVGSGPRQQHPGLATDQADRNQRGPSGNTTQLNNPADGMLYLDEVYKLKLPNTRIVVLSACESGLGRYYRGEGIVSLVRPFLAAGVPTVVPSLWRVSSAATAQLMISFQRERKQTGLSSANALSAAQRGMALRGSYEHPYYWAAFIVVGANN